MAVTGAAVQTIRTRIETSRIKSISNHRFVPPFILDAVLTREVISEAVAELGCAVEDRIGLSNDIHLRGKKTFAILVWMHAASAIVDFRRHRCLDSALPLDQARATSIAPDLGATFANEAQWEFLPYFFCRNEDVEIKPEYILPFVREVGVPIIGAFGTVTKLEIPPLLHDLGPHKDEPILIARKSLRPDAARSEQGRKALFKNEKRCLRLLNYPEHSNIVPLLCSYMHGNDYCMLFPVLDMDLAAFFKSGIRHGNFQRDFTFFSALHGLALALSRAHNIHIQEDMNGLKFLGMGYHHDLRPANILVNRETFFLADFGMGGVRPRQDDSKTPWKAGAGDYLAPECMDENLDNRDVGRAIDVWAFGCLIAEVATFIYKGTDGLEEFRRSRESAESFPNWFDTGFHDAHGNTKASVRQWLEFLVTEGRKAPLDTSLHELIFSTLTPVDDRPKIADVCLHLAQLSLKAHFFSVLDALKKVIQPGAVAAGTSMKLWFEFERFKAFGNILRLTEITLEPFIAELIGQQCRRCVDIMVELFHRLSDVTDTADVTEGPPENPGLAGELLHHETIPQNDSRDNSDEPQELIEADVQRLVQELWNLLPGPELKNAERAWVHSMLDTNDIRQLEGLEDTLTSKGAGVYQEGAAMAMMRKVRLEMINNPTGSFELRDYEVSEDDVVELGAFYMHRLGAYKQTCPIIIETMLYNPSWENVPAPERAVVMALKAKGFGVKPKPPQLRHLDCIGFFEMKGSNRQGFGFIYRLPEESLALPPHEQRITTLQRILQTSIRQAKSDPHTNQPVLEDRYRLASELAGFLAEFHSIGWLHEGFHSNNVVYFNAPSDEQGISPSRCKFLLKPYIVGLDKSRPGGEAYGTIGPSTESDFVDYRHPDYEKTMRFRNGYDYYSLGLLLLEIGLWTPLRAWSRKKDTITLSPHELRNTLVGRYVPRLGPKMGRTYENIVRALLTDVLDPQPRRPVPDPDCEREAFGKFFESIVTPLERLSNRHEALSSP